MTEEDLKRDLALIVLLPEETKVGRVRELCEPILAAFRALREERDDYCQRAERLRQKNTKMNARQMSRKAKCRNAFEMNKRLRARVKALEDGLRGIVKHAGSARAVYEDVQALLEAKP